MANTTQYSPTLQAVDPDSIPSITRANGKAEKIVTEFLDSGMGAAVVNDASAHFSASLNRYLKQQSEAGNELPVEVRGRKGATYIVRTDQNGEGE